MKVSINELKFAVRWAALGRNVPPGLADEFANAAGVIASLETDPIGPIIEALELLPTDYQWGQLQLDYQGSMLKIQGHPSAIEIAPVIGDAIRLHFQVTFTSQPPDNTLLVGYLHPLRPKIGLVPWMPDHFFYMTTTLLGQSIELTEYNWTALWQYTMKALTPATEASRLTGAGAGLDDND